MEGDIAEAGEGSPQNPADEASDDSSTAFPVSTTIFIIDRICGLVPTLARCGTVLGVFYLLYRSIQCISGKQTEFSAVASAVVTMSADRWFAWAVACLCGYGYWSEKKLRKSSIASKDAYVKHLENLVQPGRGGTSNLTEDGESKPKG
jgi:hypothetical protein